MLGRIMNNGVLGLTAQAKALSTISNNIANANTVGYKPAVSQFQDLVLGDRYGGAGSGAGVRATDRLRINEQGTITKTGVGTNAAISGNGFFIVQALASQPGKSRSTDGSDEVLLTRAGDFQPDSTGQFVNSAGRALMGVKIGSKADEDIKSISLDDLEVVSIDNMNDYQDPTKNISLSVKLPANAPISDAQSPKDYYDVPVSLIDRDGITYPDGTKDSRFANLNLRFAKTGEELIESPDGTKQTVSSWTVYKASAAYADNGQPINTPPNMAAIGSFRTDEVGALYGGETGRKVDLDLNLGSSFEPLKINLGEYGTFNGVSAIGNDDFRVQAASHDGIARHTVRDVSISDDGFVQASFAGGQTRNLYRLANGIVRNPYELEAVGGNAFRITQDSGDISARAFGAAPPHYKEERAKYGEDYLKQFVGGSLVADAVEGSATKIEDQFTTMIQAQRIYSAASKMVSTADEMMQTMIQLRA